MARRFAMTVSPNTRRFWQIFKGLSLPEIAAERIRQVLIADGKTT
jgi:hypothetical protein